MPERFRLPPVITGSSWGTVWGALWEKPPRGVIEDSDGTAVPKWTSREAMAVIAALRAAAAGDFPLWYQFAAIAYGWTPDGDRLSATAAQADAIYPADAAALLQNEIGRLASTFDSRRSDPRLELDSTAFDDKATIAEVAKALRDDGAEAQFKIPLPMCKDPQTGKPAKPVKGPDGKWHCPGGAVMIDDPITALIKALSKVAVPIALVAGAAWLLGQQTARKRRRSR
jgi:hypothetical protein